MKSKKPETPSLDSRPQHERFVETARALGCDEDKEKFEAALKKAAAHKPIKRGHRPEASLSGQIIKCILGASKGGGQ